MRERLEGAAGLAAAIVVGGALVAASGVVTMSASAGHWGITELFLEFGKRRSVSTWSMGAPEPPNLDDPALVLLGAGHYESGCAFCHGAPGRPMPAVPAAMLPPPPQLGEAVTKYDRDELFFIVKHGLKFAGMPAWPTQQRDDEVWAMVAFLERLPDLDKAGYDALVYGSLPVEGDVPELIAEQCVRCHGADGLGRSEGAFPRLAGQSIPYLHASLEAFREGDRHSGVMQPVATRLSDDAMADVAAWYGDLPPGPPFEVDAEAAGRGAAIAEDGIPSQRVPPCAQCHGPRAGPLNELYPLLAAQDPAYLAGQLKLFDAGKRGGTAYADVMETAAHELEPGQIDDVAAYYAGLPAE